MQVQQEIANVLIAAGAVEYHRSASSIYVRFPEAESKAGYIVGEILVRISNHYVPQTAERSHNRETGCGPTGGGWHEEIVTESTEDGIAHANKIISGRSEDLAE